MTRDDHGVNHDAHAASVLIVEDTIETLRLLSDLLSEQGYDVRAVTNGRQAIQAVERDPPDLILLDIDLPEVDGYEVCRHLRASDRSQDVPMIFITALTDTADKVRAFETGGVDYVTKPFQVEEVLARVKARSRSGGPGQTWPTASPAFVPWNTCATRWCAWSSTTCDRRWRRCSWTSASWRARPRPSAKTVRPPCSRRSRRSER